jgi:gluconokinase
MSVLALDVGTSSVRAQRFDERAEPADELRQEEYDSDEPAEVATAVGNVLDGEEPDATSCFAHSLIAVDGEWNALTPILGWRDTRSAGAAEWLARRLDADAIHARTGAFLHPSFWPAKLAWLAEAEPETFRRAARFVSFADYLRGSAETSLGMASTSGLLDLTSLDWDEELLATLGLDRERLPQIADVPLWTLPARTQAPVASAASEPR